MTEEEYIDLLFKAALNEEPSLSALDEVIKLTGYAIENLREEQAEED